MDTLKLNFKQTQVAIAQPDDLNKPMEMIALNALMKIERQKHRES